MSLIQDLQWRYATKKMNGQAVEQAKIDQIIEAARLAPTSSGLHPFKIIAFGQSQIVDASHLLIFAAYDEYTKERVDAPFLQQQVERGLPEGFADDYKNGLFARFQTQTKDAHFDHAARQAYIGFGIAIAAAAELRVDATPMEGFINEQLDELLGLDKLGLKSVTILALGYRDEQNDWLVNLKKVRVNKEEFVINLN